MPIYCSLSDLRKQLGGKFSIATTALLAKQMLLGIQSAHEIGFLHRDIKPGNFCIASQGSTYIDECRRLRCFLIDFGLSRRYLSSSGKVREVIDHHSHSCIRSDIFIVSWYLGSHQSWISWNCKICIHLSTLRNRKCQLTLLNCIR